MRRGGGFLFTDLLEPTTTTEELREAMWDLVEAGFLAPDSFAPIRARLAEQVAAGGFAEATARSCTVTMANRLAALRIPAVVRLPATGTHSWGYWEDQMHESWPMFARALGA